jgi:hypothetical protein
MVGDGGHRPGKRLQLTIQAVVHTALDGDVAGERAEDYGESDCGGRQQDHAAA